jgi:hypothetical protein
MDASSQTRKGGSSQESLDDKNDICLRGIFKIPPLAPRPLAGTHTFALPFYQYQFHPPGVNFPVLKTSILCTTKNYYKWRMVIIFIALVR